MQSNILLRVRILKLDRQQVPPTSQCPIRRGTGARKSLQEYVVNFRHSLKE
jgi:hypothetical protein